MRRSLTVVLSEANQIPREELPILIGELEQVRCIAFARLTSPAAEVRHDELLDVKEAAARLNCSDAYLYRNHKKLPFTRRDRVGRKLLFSSAGLDLYLKRTR
jgi:excisionase family DNA binding protein